jgi:hypothetical protein
MTTPRSRPQWLAAEKRRAARADVERDLEALNDIRLLLSGKEWDSDTLSAVAEIIRETGREIKEPE